MSHWNEAYYVDDVDPSDDELFGGLDEVPPRWAGFAPIRGRTYPVKNYLKSLGGRWDAAGKTWWVPEEHAADARAVARAGVTPSGWVDPYVAVDQATSANLAAGIVRCWECGGRVPMRAGGYSCGCSEPKLLT